MVAVKVGNYGPGELETRSRFRWAAREVKRQYPGAVGELLSNEISSWEDFGYRIGGNALMSRVVSAILDDNNEETDGG
jgi:hypothetical protein